VSWRCSVCNYPNPDYRDECLKCGKARYRVLPQGGKTSQPTQFYPFPSNPPLSRGQKLAGGAFVLAIIALLVVPVLNRACIGSYGSQEATTSESLQSSVSTEPLKVYVFPTAEEAEWQKPNMAGQKIGDGGILALCAAQDAVEEQGIDYSGPIWYRVYDMGNNAWLVLMKTRVKGTDGLTRVIWCGKHPGDDWHHWDTTDLKFQ
jgi:hypothetical protein